MRLIITMPVYDDWESAALLCAAIDDEMGRLSGVSASILMIDDGSGKQIGSAFAGFCPKAVEGVWLLRLRRNLGHQRAIAVSLAYIEQKMSCDAVIVMDADGEDRPEDIPRLVEAFERSHCAVAVFAERGRRAESMSFKLFYLAYRALHSLLTGRSIRFGNFSLLPASHLNSIVAYPELWNHYAAAVLKSRLPYTTVRADRGHRLRGRSKMNFVSLVVHGLSALFASYEVVSTRILMGATILAVSFVCMIGIVAGIKVFTPLAIPGWATLAAGLLFVLTLQVLGTAIIFIFTVMMSRSSLGFLPMRDYSYFVTNCAEILPEVTTFHYAGTELDVFAHATNWKRYWSSLILPWVGGDVLEVGAGLGANTPLLNPARTRSPIGSPTRSPIRSPIQSWTALEPDPELAARLMSKLSESPATAGCKVLVGSTESIEPEARFDTVLYIDVLEHIERDREEMERAAGLLRPAGSLIVLSPAHQRLYTPFDQAIGHFRRYDRASLLACTPSGCRMEKLSYLDSVGLLASLGNYLVLQQATPALKQILFWDRYLVRPSTFLDPLLRNRLGKSILGIWRKL